MSTYAYELKFIGSDDKGMPLTPVSGQMSASNQKAVMDALRDTYEKELGRHISSLSIRLIHATSAGDNEPQRCTYNAADATNEEDTDAMGNNTRVLVYGTLKQGHGNHRLLAGSNMLGRVRVEGPFDMLCLGGFPGVVWLDGDDAAEVPVYGEVYKVNEATLHSLDLLEGHPRFYERKKVWVTLPDEKRVKAWMYLLPSNFMRDGGEYEHCPSGMWRPTKDEAEFWQAVESEAEKAEAS
jgi:gamma-glutamylcyclotransferase (GGCT)/AIG2-like uncharacterized protein YtfP